ncbi:hypothetical protein NL676_012759 [Syzygium grande]|nr:hypothetical protein NL676_012759 [Syzygium grande]
MSARSNPARIWKNKKNEPSISISVRPKQGGAAGVHGNNHLIRKPLPSLKTATIGRVRDNPTTAGHLSLSLSPGENPSWNDGDPALPSCNVILPKGERWCDVVLLDRAT